MSWIDNLINSNEYQCWLRGQYEPEERLFIGRTPPRKTPGWMSRGADRPEPSERELEMREDDFLRKHGIE